MPKYSRYVLPLVALPVLLNACSMDRLRYEVFRAPTDLGALPGRSHSPIRVDRAIWAYGTFFWP